MSDISTMNARPLVVGFGGAGKVPGTTERLLQAALDQCAAMNCDTRLFGSAALSFPLYDYEGVRPSEVISYLDAIRRADAIIIASPSYHGSISGRLKNAIDYLEDLSVDQHPYLDGKAVGLIVTASGNQALGPTLNTLRNITHALRGWPTPIAISVNSSVPLVNKDNSIADPGLRNQVDLMVQQIVLFATVMRRNASENCS